MTNIVKMCYTFGMHSQSPTTTQNRWIVVELVRNTEGYIRPGCRKAQPFREVVHEVAGVAEAFELKNTFPNGKAQVRCNNSHAFIKGGMDEYLAYLEERETSA